MCEARVYPCPINGTQMNADLHRFLIDNHAMEVRSIVLDRGFKSIIIVPSQIDSRRTWMTFNKVFKDDEIKIISLPSHYQSFSPEGWWKDPGWVRELIFEYQRLIF